MLDLSLMGILTAFVIALAAGMGWSLGTWLMSKVLR